MEIIVRANEERFKVTNMCDALDEILEYHFKGKLEAGWQQGLQEGLQEGKENNLLELISKKLAKGKPLAQIAEELEATEEEILPLYNKAKAVFGRI
ncbi:MAG: hypothetical protein PUC73_08625 [Lachnospiraceae bacterium]|nr:hypothetical protein [Lachnospiraceae bacterium]